MALSELHKMKRKFVEVCLKICHQLLIFLVVHLYPKLANTWKNLCSLWVPNKDLEVEVNAVKLQKVPVHLAISVGQESKVILNENGNVNIAEYFEKIVEIVNWAYIFNTKFLSIYDPKGILKSHSEILCKQLTKKFENCSFESGNQIVCANKMGKDQKNSAEDQLGIFIRSRQDGKKLLLQAIKEIYVHKNSKIVPSTPITSQVFDVRLTQLLYSTLWGNMNTSSKLKTEPDLLMIMGETKSLMGSLPWHIRNTEIHILPNLLDVKYAEFLMSLQNYANCEQRFGK